MSLEIAEHITLGFSTETPNQWFEFTNINPDFISSGFVNEEYSDEAAEVVIEVHREVNRYGYAREFFGDVWRVLKPGEPGDCEDLAFTKMLILKNECGFSFDSLKIARCHTGLQNHAVALWLTTQGTYMLDNNAFKVFPWNKVPYSWFDINHSGHGWKTIIAEDKRL